MSDKFRVDFSDEELTDLLQQQITGPNADLLTAAIIGLMDDTEWKKSILIKAALGTKARPKHRLHEKYLVGIGDISLYHADKTLMREKGMINSNDKVECVLKEFNPFAFSQYGVVYNYLNDEGVEKQMKYWVHKSHIIPAEEFPEDVNDQPF